MERVHPADRERFTRDIEAFFASLDREAHVEYRLRRASGEYIRVHDRLVVERGRRGEPIRLVSMVEERIEPPSPPAPDPHVRYRDLFERTRDAVLLVDTDGRLLDFNPAFLELLGLDAETASGRPITEFYRDPAVRDRLVEEITRTGSVSDREIHLVAADGTPRVVLASAVASRTTDGSYAGHQAIFHDITERSRSEESRRRRTERLEERVGALRSLYAISELLGRAELLDRGILEEIVALIPGGLRVPARARSRVEVGEAEVSASGFDPETAQVVPLARTPGDGPIGSVAVSYLPAGDGAGAELVDEDLEFLGEVAARIREAARRIEAVEARRREEAYYRTLVERSADLLAILDPDGSIRFVSPVAERLLGYPRGSLVGMSALDLIHPDDREAADEALAEAASRPDRAPTLEHRVRHADGTWRYFESTGRSFLEDPDILGIVVNGRDVTDRKGLEEQLRHVQKMEAVARLAGGVAHEFNNLLTVIRVSTRLLEDHFQGEPLPEELADIDVAASGAAILTRRLLAFSGRAVLNPRTVDLGTLVRELETFLSRIADPEVEVVLDLPRSPLPIRADLLQIEQVVLNLCENALEAMPGGGRLVLEVRTARAAELPPQLRHPDDWVILRVTDSGQGVPEEVRSRIFEPFFTTKEGGTGLGLPTVRSIVWRLGGLVEVESASGRGTVVTVCLPRTSEAPLPETEREEVAAFPQGRTVLVLEEDPASRSVVNRLLSAAGYRVLEAGGGVAALTLLDAYGGPLDLLVTSQDMPDLDAEALAARIRTTYPQAEVLYLMAPDAEGEDATHLRRDTLSWALLPAVEELLADLPAPDRPG